jgi:hypothetical protein
MKGMRNDGRSRDGEQVLEGKMERKMGDREMGERKNGTM